MTGLVDVSGKAPGPAGPGAGRAGPHQFSLTAAMALLIFTRITAANVRVRSETRASAPILGLAIAAAGWCW